jgi:uncharacterized glyoxalase superfamily protein PhnB
MARPRSCDAAGPATSRPTPTSYDWDVYLRLDRTPFRELFAALSQRGVVTRRLERMFYGLAEFEITDPDGYVVCLSQSLAEASDLPQPEASLRRGLPCLAPAESC